MTMYAPTSLLNRALPTRCPSPLQCAASFLSSTYILRVGNPFKFHARGLGQSFGFGFAELLMQLDEAYQVIHRVRRKLTSPSLRCSFINAQSSHIEFSVLW